MKENNQALRVALAAAEQLSPRLRRQLALRLLAGGTGTERVVVLHELPAEKQERLRALLEKSNEGTLTAAEQGQLKRLGAEADAVMLANSKALAQNLRPAVFDKRGRLVRKRLQSL